MSTATNGDAGTVFPFEEQPLVEGEPTWERMGKLARICTEGVERHFGQKLDYLTEMRDWFRDEGFEKSILVGDLNIAPREDDVWNHKQLLKVVSHTPIEVEHLAEVQDSGGWVDITRKDIPEGNLYSWWSYRSPDWDAADKGRRLDHVWATQDIANAGHASRVLRDVRGWEQPSDHAPVFASFDL